MLCLEGSKNINEKIEGIKQPSISEVIEEKSSSESEKPKQMFARKVHVEDLLLTTK